MLCLCALLAHVVENGYWCRLRLTMQPALTLRRRPPAVSVLPAPPPPRPRARTESGMRGGGGEGEGAEALRRGGEEARRRGGEEARKEAGGRAGQGRAGQARQARQARRQAWQAGQLGQSPVPAFSATSRALISSQVNLRTKIMDFRGFDSSRSSLNHKGWNFQARKEFPGKFESSNLSRDNLSTEIGRTRDASPRAMSQLRVEQAIASHQRCSTGGTKRATSVNTPLLRPQSSEGKFTMSREI